ncbi:hypothetical protein FRC10_009533, partial [Ceratobasidium sp. 414]
MSTKEIQDFKDTYGIIPLAVLEDTVCASSIPGPGVTPTLEQRGGMMLILQKYLAVSQRK